MSKTYGASCSWESWGKDKDLAIRRLVESDDHPCKTRAEAEAYLQKYVPFEKYYQSKILQMIKRCYPSAVAWKAAAGSYSSGGVPDICVVYEGHFYGFEVKRPFFGRESELQKKFIARIREAGGVAEVVCYPSEVAAILDGGGVDE